MNTRGFTMRTKKGKDCPICGEKDCIEVRSKFKDSVTPKGYTAIEVGPLSGNFCKKCGEGLLNKESERLLDKQVAEGKAIQDSKRLVAADIIDIDSVVKRIKVSRQRIHKMMEEGKLPYVFIGTRRYPIKNPSIFETLRKKVRTHALQKIKKGNVGKARSGKYLC